MSPIQFLSSQAWVERLGSTLIQFLWQGVVIATLYAVARWRMGQARGPQTRYLLACAALIVMLAAPVVTFSLSGPSGSSGSNPPVGTVPFSTTPVHTGATLSAVLPVFAADAWHDDVMPWLVMAWFFGAIVFWARLVGGWMVAARMRSMHVRSAASEWQRKLDELRTRIRISRPVRLLVSAIVQVPTVVGWLRPVVLMPVGALAGLPAEHVEALLAHELAHIRRHDYLASILQSIAEALLFYHPAVWWVSKHVREERELCCDDIAVAVSGDALVYARALAGLESYRPAHITPALAANGGSLVDRVARLVDQPRPNARRQSGPVVALVFIVAVTAIAIFAQPSVSSQFEAASIKLSTEQGFMRVTPMPGRLNATASLLLLMENAYGLQPFQITGGPAWISSDRYVIEARADGAANRDQVLLMLRSLLEDRFKLTIHHETAERPVYALVAAKSGIKLPHPQEGSCVTAATGQPNWAGDGGRMPPPGQGPAPLARCGMASIVLAPSGARIQGGKIPMAELTRILSMALGRVVIDKTGFTELFDARLEFLPDLATPNLPPPPPGPDGAGAASNSPSILTALREQLGLAIESTKGPVDTVVIDRVEQPSEN